jgi:hypothetical protein
LALNIILNPIPGAMPLKNDEGTLPLKNFAGALPLKNDAGALPKWIY